MRDKFELNAEAGKPLLQLGEQSRAAFGDLGGDRGALDNHLGEHRVQHIEEWRRAATVCQVDPLSSNRDRQAGIGDDDEVPMTGLGDHPGQLRIDSGGGTSHWFVLLVANSSSTSWPRGMLGEAPRRVAARAPAAAALSTASCKSWPAARDAPR